MPVPNNTIMAADQRPIRLRRRHDLVVRPVTFQGEESWIIKDPISLKYVRLQGPEYLVFGLLDGQATYQQLKQTLDREYPDRIVRHDDLQTLISSLHRRGLLISENPGQAVPLLERQGKQRNQKRLSLLVSLLAIKFPGVDPERFLNWLYPRMRWLLSRTAFCLVVVLVLAAAFLILNNWQEFLSKLPEFQRFFSGQNLLLMAVVLMVTKSIHELGHGLVCKHFGGECHEIGFMLLVVTPTLYCNTSDSWILPSKWQRAAIGAAGMYFEAILASLCTFVWWYTQPGEVHYFCLNVMFVSGVSTIVFNANPLLRYDGYYIMSDLLEVPNLAQKSRMAILNKLRVWFLGMKPMNSRFLPQRNQELFAVYAVASVAYRWFVLFSILYFLSRVFEPYGLETLGHILIAGSLVGLIVVPLVKMFKFFSYPGRIRQVKRKNLIYAFGLVAVLVYLTAWFPFPHHVMAPVVVRPDEAQRLYVTSSGIIVEQGSQPGEQVQAGDLILRLENPDLLLAVEEQQAVLAELRARKRDLLSRLAKGDSLPTEDTLATIDEQLDAAEKILQDRRDELAALEIRANRSGILIPPTQRPRTTTTQVSFGSWSKTPLAAEARNGFVAEGTDVGYVGDPEKMKGLLVVEQGDIQLIEPGQPVQIMLDEYPGVRLRTRVRDISREDKKTADQEASVGGGPLQTRLDESGVERPLLPSYEVTVPLHSTDRRLLPGFRGRARIRVGQATLCQMAYRQILNLIHFR